MKDHRTTVGKTATGSIYIYIYIYIRECSYQGLCFRCGSRRLDGGLKLQKVSKSLSMLLRNIFTMLPESLNTPVGRRGLGSDRRIVQMWYSICDCYDANTACIIGSTEISKVINMNDPRVAVFGFVLSDDFSFLRPVSVEGRLYQMFACTPIESQWQFDAIKSVGPLRRFLMKAAIFVTDITTIVNAGSLAPDEDVTLLSQWTAIRSKSREDAIRAIAIATTVVLVLPKSTM